MSNWYPPHVTFSAGCIGLEWARRDRRLTIFIGPDGVDIIALPEPEQAFGLEDLEKALEWCLADRKD